jgi:uroporphyrinogen-III synthase
MPKNKIHILSTGPIGKVIVKKAALQNIIVDEIEFIKTEEISDKGNTEKIKSLLNGNITAIFTSMNAVEAVGKLVTTQPTWKIFSIGNTTKNLIIKYFGKESISATAGNATLLAEKIVEKKIVEKKDIREVTFFCSDKRRNELPEKLKSNGIKVHEIIVYRTTETARTISKVYDGILFFSPSAVNSFLLKNKVSPGTQLFAIGSTTAKALQPFTNQHVIIAETPGKENLLNLAINLFSKSKIV